MISVNTRLEVVNKVYLKQKGILLIMHICISLPKVSIVENYFTELAFDLSELTGLSYFLMQSG